MEILTTKIDLLTRGPCPTSLTLVSVPIHYIFALSILFVKREKRHCFLLVLICLKLNTLHPSPKDAFEASLISIGPVILEKKIFKFSLFVFVFVLERGLTLHLNKLASPLLEDALFQIWLKWRQFFFKISLIQSLNFVIISH